MFLLEKVLDGCVETQRKLVQADNAVHDPPGVQTDLQWVTLLPLEHQGPHDRLTEGIDPTGT